MDQFKIRKARKIQGEFTAPADKSVSQRAVMLGSLGLGKIRIENFLDCDDCRRAISAFSAMGVKIKMLKAKKGQTILEIEGKGLNGLTMPNKDLYIGNSGTTMRLIAGILAGQSFKTRLTGDASLSRRPMQRIISPLQQMGARIKARKSSGNELPPLSINSAALKAIDYSLPIPSAQVKSCVLLAGLFAKGTTRVSEKLKTRDHTERMLKKFQANIRVKSRKISVGGGKELINPEKIFIPGDISSCAFFIVSALLVRNSSLVIRQVGLNPTRIGVLKILKKMGAKITILPGEKHITEFEPYADLKIESSDLKAVTLNKNDVAYCIDELPILCVAACFAKGRTIIRGADELRVKETDRIHSIVTNLKAMGAKIETRNNNIFIEGTGTLKPAVVESFGDHRTAMSMAVAGLMCDGETLVKNITCVNKSFPDFLRILKNITN